MRVPWHPIPVEERVDLVVAGASFVGAALALAVARAGRRVVVVEPRTYPGYEASALLRYWCPVDALTNPPALFRPWLRRASVRRGNELALRPDPLKRGIEDALLGAGVKLIYASQPVGVVFRRAALAGIVIANKSGRQVILSKCVADATERGMVARLAGERFRMRVHLPGIVPVKRTLEFTGVSGGFRRQWARAEGVSVVRAHQGVAGPGHLSLECELEVPIASGDWRGLMAAELEARRRTYAFASLLMRGNPAFRRALFASSSFELWLPALSRLDTGARRVHPNLAVLGSAGAHWSETASAASLEPLEAARAGDEASREVLRVMRGMPLPEAGECLAVCGSPLEGKKGARGPAVREPRREGRHGIVRAVSGEVPVLSSVDVLVAGGGTSGVPAAAAAAGEGVRTALLEMNSGLGGTGTLGGVNTYWYGHKGGFTAAVDRQYLARAREVRASREAVAYLRRLPDSGLWHHEARMQALLDLVGGEKGEVFFRSAAVGALVRGKRVVGAMVATPDGLAAVPAKVVVEATGDGDIAAFAGAKWTQGGARDGVCLYYSLGPFPWPGYSTNSFATMVDITDAADVTRAILAGRRRFIGHDHGPYLAPRESRHIRGGYTVTLEDQLLFRSFPDTVCVCHDGRDIKGLTSADWALWGLNYGKIYGEIPYRAVLPEGLEGILVAGKAYSATHEGLAMARMQADMQNLGGACGLAAAMAVRADVSPRRVDVRALRRRLMGMGALPRKVLERRTGWRPPTGGEVQAIVARLRGDELQYAEGAWRKIQTKVQPIARICGAGRFAVPILVKAHRNSTGARRLLLARLLAWHGSAAGAATLHERILGNLRGGRLPASSRERGPEKYPPDNAGLPETCRLVYALGLTGDRRALDAVARVARLVRRSRGDFADSRNGLFYYVQIACLVAERFGSPEALPALKILHAIPGLHGLATRSFQPGIMEERIGYLEVALARAMARCGSVQGARILAGYLGDARAWLAGHAHSELAAVARRDYGREPRAWLRWLKGRKRLRPRPWLRRSE